MVLFNEVRALAETSQEAFTHFYDIMSRKDSAAKDVLYICSTTKVADEVFSDIARGCLESKISKNQRRIEMPDGSNIYVHPIMMLSPWLPGHRFKNIIFDR